MSNCIAGKFIEVKVVYEKPTETGENKKVTEQYLAMADNFTDAESMTKDELDQYGQIADVSAVKKSNVSCVYTEDTGNNPFYRVKIDICVLLDNGKEKHSAEHWLVCAGDIVTATQKALKELAKGEQDYKIVKVEETSIQDVLQA